MRSTRRPLLTGLALLAGFAIGLLLWRRPPIETVAAVRESAPLTAAPRDAAPVAPAAPAPSPSPRRYTVQTETVLANLDAPTMRSITASTAEDYRRRARFPEWSQPIEDGVDPIARDREVTHDRSLGAEGDDPTLVTFPARTSFEAPQPVVLYAYLVQDQEKVDARTIRGEVRTQQGGVLAALEFHDDGREGDSEGNDLVWTAHLVPPRGAERELKGAQLVEVHAETAKGELRVATTGFLYSVPLAHLTGRYRDQLVDGNLRVEAEVAVEAAGRFHLEATLATSDGTPVGWAQHAATLAAGPAWLPLTYWGLMFREQAVDGPYVLRSVALSTTGEMPNQKNDVVEWAFVTRAYRTTEFSDRRFDDPDLLETARRLEQETPIGALQADR